MQQEGNQQGSAMDGLVPEAELWQQFSQTRDPDVREELVNRYLSFAKGLAMRYRGASESPDDLIQVASLGLINAIDRFDPERGTPFAAFAAPTILGELKRHFRDRVWTVRVPRGLHDRMAEVDKAIAELTRDLQRSPTVREIADRMEVDDGAVLEVMEANHNRRPLSLDRPGPSDDADDPTPAEWLGKEDAGFDLIEGRIALEEAIPHLSERERLRFWLRFFAGKTRTQKTQRSRPLQMQASPLFWGTPLP